MKSLKESLFDKDLAQKRIIDKLDLVRVYELVVNVYDEYKSKFASAGIAFHAYPPLRKDGSDSFELSWSNHVINGNKWIYEVTLRFDCRVGKNQLWVDPVLVDSRVRRDNWSLDSQIRLRYEFGKYIYWDEDNPKDEDVLNIIKHTKDIFEGALTMRKKLESWYESFIPDNYFEAEQKNEKRVNAEFEYVLTTKWFKNIMPN